MKQLRRDVVFGLVWLLGWLVADAIASIYSIQGALRKIAHDPTVTPVVRDEVLVFITQVVAVYFLLGVVAGLVVHLWRRAHGGSNGRRLQIGFAVATTLWMVFYGSVMWPRMFLGLPGVELLANNANPHWFTFAYLVFLAGWWLRGWRANRTHPKWTVALVAACALISVADWHPPADSPRRNAGPNVLIVGFDALRPDHQAFFGYDRQTTPALDRFLEQAEVFDSAFTPLARTWPAWASMLTGTYPLTHGKRDSLPAAGQERPAVPMITDVLVDEGVHTRFLTDDSRFSYMLPVHNFQSVSQPFVGIRAFALSRSQPYFRPFFMFLHGPLGWSMVDVYRYNQAMGVTHRPEAFSEHVAQNIAEASQHERFFMVVHFCLLHAPGDRPWPYHQMYGMPEARGSNRFKYRSTGSKTIDGDEYTDDELERLERRGKQQNIDLYDSGLAMVDESWARISRALDEGDLWDDTLVIVLSDHGEEFHTDDDRYKFRGPNHGFHPWGIGQHHVLLSAKGPGFDPAVRRSEVVSLVDVAPTVARAFDVPFDSEGLALQDPLPTGRVVFGETGASEQGYWAKGHTRYSIRRSHHRYTVDPITKRVYQRPKYDRELAVAKDRWAFDDRFWLVSENLIEGPRYSMYEWRKDPLLRVNISGVYPENASRLQQHLEQQPMYPGEPSIAELQADDDPAIEAP